MRPIFCINTSLKHFRQVWTSLDQLCKVGCITARWNPSSIYKWSIGHILEQEFFYFGFLGSSGSKGKKVDLSYSEQLLRVVFSTFCGQKNLNFLFANKKLKKKTPSKVAQKNSNPHFSLLPELLKRPKQKNSCFKMWLIDQLYIKLGLLPYQRQTQHRKS